MTLPRNMHYQLALVQWWSPSRYGEDFVKDTRLKPLTEFPFAQYGMSRPVPRLGWEMNDMRPVILGPYIHIPQITVIENALLIGNTPVIRLRLHHSGLIYRENHFMLHSEWWYEKLLQYDSARTANYSSTDDHWVEATYFKREDEIWKSLAPADVDMDEIKRCVIITSLSI